MLKTISSITNALGALNYKGTWNASTNTPTLTSSVGAKGDYYVVSVAGTTNLNGEALWGVGDWAVFNGSVWQRVEGGDTVNATTVNASTSVTTPIVQASNTAGLALKNASGTTQLLLGAGGGDNLALNVSTNINGANAQIDISPSGTGHVHIKPAGSGSIEIAPTSAGTINNMSIGATTALTGRFTTVTSTIATGTAPLVVTSTTEVANLRAANATSADTANQVKSNTTTGVLQVTGPAAAATRVMTTPDANFTVARTDAGQTFTGVNTFTSPKIITDISDTNGNELIKVTATASAVNELTVANAATGNNPILSATGSDTNIGITLTPKGTGNAVLTSGNLVVANGQGIDFSATPGTGTSELLSDYEEGSWTPTIASGATGITYSVQNGQYTKIGRQVIFNLNLVTSAATATASQFKIGGLPFAAGTIGGAYFMYASAFIASTTTNLPTSFVLSNIDMYQTDSTNFLGTDVSVISAFNIHMYGQYTT